MRPRLVGGGKAGFAVITRADLVVVHKENRGLGEDYRLADYFKKYQKVIQDDDD